MHLLATLASLAGLELTSFTSRLKRDAGAWGAVAVFAAIAIVFALVALNAWTTAMLGPIGGPLVIAVVALGLALITYVTLRMLAAAAERRELERRKTAERTALVTTAALTALPALLRSNLFKKMGLPLGGVLAAAFLMAQGSDKSDEDGPADAPAPDNPPEDS